MRSIESLVENEQARREAFPVCGKKIFVSHAAVTVLPRVAAEAMNEHIRASCEDHQEFGDVLRNVKETRNLCARIIGANADEIALLGPTSLGLSLFANGMPWEAGDEIVCYAGDYPANVYPWIEQRRRGVNVRLLEPEVPGRLTPELVESALTPRTRLVALASANFLTGHKLDIDAIGKLCHSRGILFSVDAIQTLGAFPVSVEHVDFLSADAHKWMLGPLAIGIVYVKKQHFELLRPTLLGAWNVISPNFIAQPDVKFVPTAQRYEPGVLNITGIYGMRAALELIEEIGIGKVSSRILALRTALIDSLRPRGFEFVSPLGGDEACGILTFSHPTVSGKELFRRMEEANIVATLRHNSEGREFIRVSPHFYNTFEEIQKVSDTLVRGL